MRSKFRWIVPALVLALLLVGLTLSGQTSTAR